MLVRIGFISNLLEQMCPSADARTRIAKEKHGEIAVPPCQRPEQQADLACFGTWVAFYPSQNRQGPIPVGTGTIVQPPSRGNIRAANRLRRRHLSAMESPQLSARLADSEFDTYEDSGARRARKNHSVLVSRNRRSQLKNKKRRSGSGRNKEESVVGITHRRNRRWSW